MRKVSIHTVFVIMISSTAWAQTMAPASTDASKNSALVPVVAATELAKPMLLTAPAEAFNKRWAFSGDLHGTPNPGLGLLIHTPIFWNFLGLRAGYSFDSAGNGSFRKSYGAITTGVKFNTFADSSENLFPYVQINFNFFQRTDSDNTLGYEVAYGAEWRHKVLTFGGSEIDHAVFIEGGWSFSDTKVNGASVGDGFVSRLGLRRLF